jgi:hypothetical protein
MVKKLCVAGLAAAALLQAPAYADTNAGNASSNRSSVQSGNNFGNVVNSNRTGPGVTSLNNVNGNAITSSGGGQVRIDDVIG